MKGAMVKRFTSWVSILSLAFALSVTASTLAASDKLLLNVATANITSGAEFNVTVRVDTYTKIEGLRVDLSYSPSQLAYVSATSYGTAFPELWVQTLEASSISAARSTGGASVSGNNVFVTYRFKANAVSGQTVIEATGSANAGGSELALAKSVLTLNISSGAAPAPVPAGTAAPTTSSSLSSGGQQSAPTQSTQAVGSNTDKPDSLDSGGETQSGRTKSANMVSGTLGKITNLEEGNKLLLLGIAGAVLVVTGGVWFGLRAHKRARYAAHFPATTPLPTNFLKTISQAEHGQELSEQTTHGSSVSPAQSALHSNQQPLASVSQTVSPVAEPFVIQPTVPAPPTEPVPTLPPANNVVVMPENTVGQPNEPPKTN